MFWIDLSDGDAGFYARLFGWSLEGDVFTCEGRVVAGYGGPVPDGTGPAWTPHVFVDDPDAAAAGIAAAGGRVEVEPRDTPRGRTAVVTDPSGARFAVREPKRRAEHLRTPSGLTWCELGTADVPAAQAFYADRFGWDPVATSMALPAGEVPYTVFVRDGEEMAGLIGASPFPPGWLSYVEVTDCDVAVRVAAALGGDVVVPPLDIPRIGRVAVLAGRTGETLAVMQMPAPT